MYIKKIVLENIRCFKHAEIDFQSDQEPYYWTVLLGDNGVGKTTLLRSIAMGLSDTSSAAGLLRELPGPFIRRGETKAVDAATRSPALTR